MTAKRHSLQNNAALPNTNSASIPEAVAQLSLVEHALCPLDIRASLREDLRHQTSYCYTDCTGVMQTANVVVHCPAGLSPNDEFYLWGLLALTLDQASPQIEFQATPHYCLRKLGMISPGSKGGKNYRLFRESLRRLSAVVYQNDGFYDPILREHRQISLGLLSYSLPLRLDSSRAWRIVWNPLFFEYILATASQLKFDLEVYRNLDPASRRLFLLLSKIFWRKAVSPHFDLRHLAVDVLGFSPTLATRTLKAKVARCAQVLQDHEVLKTDSQSAGQCIRKQRKGQYRAQFVRGTHYDRQHRSSRARSVEDSPLFDPLEAIGFDRAAVQRILRRFPTQLIQLWADVTLAAIESKGKAFFRRSPEAFFMDNIKNAAAGNRTPPDWFWQLRHQEQRRRADRARQARPAGQPRCGQDAAAHHLASVPILDLDQGSEGVARELLAHFRAAGQSEEKARRNARRFAEELHRNKHPQPTE